MVLSRSTLPIVLLIGLALPVVSEGAQLERMEAGSQKEAQEWMYPGARRHHGSGGGAGNPFGMVHQDSMLLTTKDSFEDVVKFYKKKIGAEGEVRKVEANAHNQELSALVVESDSKRLDGQNRSVNVEVLVKQSNATSISVVISRARDEELTHIVWTRCEVKQTRP